MLDIEIGRVLLTLEHLDPSSEEYAAASVQLIPLYKARNEKNRDGVSKDTVALISANLLGLVLVLNHEHVNVISSKAFGMIMKAR